MPANDAIDVPPAKDLREVHSQIEEAISMCVDHYVRVCDTVLFVWKAIIEKELETCRNVSTFEFFKCSKCGHGIAVEYDSYLYDGDYMADDFEYCPYCGRRIENAGE